MSQTLDALPEVTTLDSDAIIPARKAGVTSKITVANAILALTAGKEATANRRNTFQSTPDNNHYPSEKCVKDALNAEVTARNTAISDAVIGLYDDRGNFDARVNTFPTTGGSGTSGAIKKGDVWLLSFAATSGVLNGVPVGATVRALSDTPGQTTGNWAVGGSGVDQTARTAAAAAQTAADLNTSSKADKTTTISAGGLATGGGSLAANRTIIVPIASQAEAEAGSSNEVAMTPLRAAQAIAALATGGSGITALYETITGGTLTAEVLRLARSGNLTSECAIVGGSTTFHFGNGVNDGSNAWVPWAAASTRGHSILRVDLTADPGAGYAFTLSSTVAGSGLVPTTFTEGVEWTRQFSPSAASITIDAAQFIGMDSGAEPAGRDLILVLKDVGSTPITVFGSITVYDSSAGQVSTAPDKLDVAGETDASVIAAAFVSAFSGFFGSVTAVGATITIAETATPTEGDYFSTAGSVVVASNSASAPVFNPSATKDSISYALSLVFFSVSNVLHSSNVWNLTVTTTAKGPDAIIASPDVSGWAATLYSATAGTCPETETVAMVVIMAAAMQYVTGATCSASGHDIMVAVVGGVGFTAGGLWTMQSTTYTGLHLSTNTVNGKLLNLWIETVATEVIQVHIGLSTFTVSLTAGVRDLKGVADACEESLSSFLKTTNANIFFDADSLTSPVKIYAQIQE